jgi:hypothetical protein
MASGVVTPAAEHDAVLDGPAAAAASVLAVVGFEVARRATASLAVALRTRAQQSEHGRRELDRHLSHGRVR